MERVIGFLPVLSVLQPWVFHLLILPIVQLEVVVLVALICLKLLPAAALDWRLRWCLPEQDNLFTRRCGQVSILLRGATDVFFASLTFRPECTAS